MGRRSYLEGVRERARRALSKPAPYGPDVDVARFAPASGDADLGDPGVVSRAAEVGVDLRGASRGFYYQVDSVVKMYRSLVPGLEIMRIDEAIEERWDEVEPYLWRAVAPDTDKYTALVALRGMGGYFIRVRRGVRVELPIQACFFLTGGAQLLHNIVVLEPGAEATVVTGCTAMRERPGLHVGVTEVFVGEGARVVDVMVHSWGRAMHVRPRTGVVVERGGSYASLYINMSRVETLQTMPRVRLVGEGSRAYTASIVLGLGSSVLDVGSLIELGGRGASAQNIGRAVARDSSSVVSRLAVVGAAPGTRGYVECSGLMLSPSASIEAVPALRALVEDSELFHEASIGRLRDEDIAYLVSKGLSRREAIAMLVRGFVEIDLGFLTPQVREGLRRTLDMLAERSL